MNRATSRWGMMAKSMAASQERLLPAMGLPFSRPTNALQAIPYALPIIIIRAAPRMPCAFADPWVSTRRCHDSLVGFPRVSA